MRLWRRFRVLVAGMALLAAGGCITSQQWADFFRTEVARVIADSVGRAVALYGQATT